MGTGNEWEWLEWPGWGGIGGIVALLALAAGLVAVIDLLLKWRNRERFGVNMRFRRSGSIVNDWTDIDIEIRAIGEATMYEVEVFTNGFRNLSELPAVTPVLAVRDEPIAVTIRAPAPLLDTYWVGIEWIERNRNGSRSRAIRHSLPHNGTYQVWQSFWYDGWYGERQGYWTTKRPMKLRPLSEDPR